MRRLFFTFAGGPPGIGLLLIRLLVGGSVLAHSATVLRAGPAAGVGVSAVLSIGLGLLVIAGLWTPVASGLIVFGAVWSAFRHPLDFWFFASVGMLGLALALLGPGAWSWDARLFGWKRL